MKPRKKDYLINSWVLLRRSVEYIESTVKGGNQMAKKKGKKKGGKGASYGGSFW